MHSERTSRAPKFYTYPAQLQVVGRTQSILAGWERLAGGSSHHRSPRSHLASVVGTARMVNGVHELALYCIASRTDDLLVLWTRV